MLIRAVVSSCVTACLASPPCRLVLESCLRVLLPRNSRAWIRPLLLLRRSTTLKKLAMRVTIPLMKRANSALTACSSIQTPRVASSSPKIALPQKAGANPGPQKRKLLFGNANDITPRTARGNGFLGEEPITWLNTYHQPASLLSSSTGQR